MFARFVRGEFSILYEGELHYNHVIYSVSSHEYIRLGRDSNIPAGRRFEGPIIRLDGQYYLLPRKYLNLLIERFLDRQGEDNVVINLSDILLDVPENALKSYSIGLGINEDVSLSLYLPEISFSPVYEEIKLARLTQNSFGPQSID